MTQGGKEMKAGRWWGTLKGPYVRDAFDHVYSRYSYFRNPMSEFPLTYRSELIDEYLAMGAKRLTLNSHRFRRCSLIRSTNPNTQPLVISYHCCVLQFSNQWWLFRHATDAS